MLITPEELKVIELAHNTISNIHINIKDTILPYSFATTLDKNGETIENGGLTDQEAERFNLFMQLNGWCVNMAHFIETAKAEYFDTMEKDLNNEK